MKETDEKSVKCTGKKPYIIGFIAGIAFVFIVVAKIKSFLFLILGRLFIKLIKYSF